TLHRSVAEVAAPSPNSESADACGDPRKGVDTQTPTDGGAHGIMATLAKMNSDSAANAATLPATPRRTRQVPAAKPTNWPRWRSALHRNISGGTESAGWFDVAVTPVRFV